MGEFNESEHEKVNNLSENIKGFINECCILEKDNRVRGIDLHNKYMEYCKDKDINPLELITFYKKTWESMW